MTRTLFLAAASAAAIGLAAPALRPGRRHGDHRSQHARRARPELRGRRVDRRERHGHRGRVPAAVGLVPGCSTRARRPGPMATTSAPRSRTRPVVVTQRREIVPEAVWDPIAQTGAVAGEIVGSIIGGTVGARDGRGRRAAGRWLHRPAAAGAELRSTRNRLEDRSNLEGEVRRRAGGACGRSRTTSTKYALGERRARPRRPRHRRVVYVVRWTRRRRDPPTRTEAPGSRPLRGLFFVRSVPYHGSNPRGSQRIRSCIRTRNDIKISLYLPFRCG